jgi:KUP system potassium uptake protein
MEGLVVSARPLAPYVLPITLVILFFLFFFQRHGTERIARVFGPFTLLWFVVIGVLGAVSVVQTPGILHAVDPIWALRFFEEEGLPGVLILGAVFLVVTGGEALYADMGHFGRAPIRLAWFAVVLPSLVLNYFGQGALLPPRSHRHREPLLPAGPRLGPPSPGRSRHRRLRDRLPGGHLRLRSP